MMRSERGGVLIVSGIAGGTTLVTRYWRSARGGSAGKLAAVVRVNLTIPGMRPGDAHGSLQRLPEGWSSMTGLASWYGRTMPASHVPSAGSVQELVANAVWHSSNSIPERRETTTFDSRLIFMAGMLSDPLGDCN